MRTKVLFLTFVMILAYALSACAPALPANAQTTPPRTINVNGTGQVVLTPDIAYISIGVHTDSKDAAEAVSENNVLTQTVIDALLAQDIESKDIRTSNFSVYPQQQYGPNGELLGTTFVVDNTVVVTVRDLGTIGELLDAAVGAGANNIYGVSFDVTNKEAAQEEARTKAVQNAQAMAAQLAEAAGVTLGAIQTISAYSSAPVPYYDVKGYGGVGAEAASVPISAGQLTISADVSIIYEISD
jgi:hypothetical protein